MSEMRSFASYSLALAAHNQQIISRLSRSRLCSRSECGLAAHLYVRDVHEKRDEKSGVTGVHAMHLIAGGNAALSMRQ